ncbi:MAG: hydroxyacid dehydrogenase [Microbacteriaceae bacterium]|nr:hydroxyacid dehydrogenase [Microbacteriaceae bacterium]
MTGEALDSGTVLVTSRSFSQGSVDTAARLTAAGFDIVTAAHHHDLAELAPLLPETVAWISGTGHITSDHLALAPRLRIVARYGVGTDAVDLEAAEDAGIIVSNTPIANSESVADLALALLLSSLRTIPAGDRAIRRGDWSAIRGREIGSLTVGIAGFGRIGRSVAAKVLALGGSVVAYDPFVASDHRVTMLDDFAALASCDAVSLHAPGGQRLVTAGWLAAASGMALVNTARGDLVDEDAVAAALGAGALASYAADTLDTEKDPDAVSPLLAADLADRVTITPHLGAQTIDAVDRMSVGTTEDVLLVLSGAAPRNPVLSARKARR